MNKLLFFIYCRPLSQIAAAMIITCTAWTVLSLIIPKGLWKKINCVFLLFSVCGILFATVLNRNIGAVREILLIPFSFLKEAQGNPEIYRSVLMNSLLFLPFGLTLPFSLPEKIKHRLTFSVCAAALLSAICEIIQLLSYSGRCETDDVLSNIFGAFLGTLPFVLYRKIRHKSRKAENLTAFQKDFLSLVSSAMTRSEYSPSENTDLEKLCSESIFQAVALMSYDSLAKNRDKYALASLGKYSSAIIMKNSKVQYHHGAMHTIMTENKIPYVIIKGMASSSYYPEPFLRTLGDVDLLVSKEDYKKAVRILTENGYKQIGDSEDGIHTALRSKDNITVELHREINGIPEGSGGVLCREYLNDIISSAVKYSEPGSGFDIMIPTTFHHGLILLLHTVSHITTSGIGIRHLCDWSAFISKIGNDSFKEIFEEKLRKCGLFEFAKLITLVCTKYLGAPPMEWAKGADSSLIDKIAADIFDAGNFGQKDEDRTRQIKYIANRNQHTVDNKNILVQLSDTIKAKSKAENKSKAAVMTEYIKMLFRKERKIDSQKTLLRAKERKELYSRFHLFEGETEIKNEH